MPELKQNFIKGIMNLDLDERLINDGEYREAMNIEVQTSEGSAVGTVQGVRGNNKLTSLVPGGGYVVGSYANEKTNKIYYLVQCNKFAGVAKDMIVEFNPITNAAVPVFVDIYEIDYNFTSAITSPQGFLILDPNIVSHQSVREGMHLSGTLEDSFFGTTVQFFQNSLVITNPISGITNVTDSGVIVTNVQNFPTGNQANLITESTGDPFGAMVGGNSNTVLTFNSERILNFKSEKHITGINIVDDLLFFTDNNTEPKKINIKDSKFGTPSFAVHSKFPVFHPSNNSIVVNKFAKLYNTTVIKKSPLTPPSLEMYNDINGRGLIFGKTDPVNFSDQVLTNPGAGAGNFVYNNEPFVEGTPVDIEFSSVTPDFEIGDILIFSNDTDILSELRVFTDAQIRAVVTEIDTSVSPDKMTVKILSFKKGFFPYTAGGEEWAVCLEQSKALFEFKFPRFAYRYKYQDGEYSSFSPFSDVAFVPGRFRYDAKEAYNLGMVNQLRFLKIFDFVPDGLPEGVVCIDILYKESNSPNVYTVKTIEHGDPQWLSYGQQPPFTGITKGALQLESELIYAAVPSNQILRPWDNVPIKARSQEISANRLIFGNYTEGYDINNNVNINTYLKSLDISPETSEDFVIGKGYPSIKSLRTYQVGIVYRDRFGRETPVFTNEKASFNIAKQLADKSTSLSVQSTTSVPFWVHSYKYFVKETSNEYYNLALDRWYDATDGGIWLSFPSAERNKVDEDTYLILKKKHDSDDFVEEPARYKIISIKNEAPDWIKTEFSSISIESVVNPTTFAKEDSQVPFSGSSLSSFQDFIRGKEGLVLRLFDSDQSSDWFPIKSFDFVNDTIDIKNTFGIDVTAEVLGGNTSSVKMEVAQKRTYNKPEFQGRFFVKVKQDTALINGIDTINHDITTTTFKIIQSKKQYYIKSSGLDNNWSQKEQWTDKAGSWDKVIKEGFYIDEIDRNWGTVPGGPGPWAKDSGKGITYSRTGKLANHIELSLSRVNDQTQEGFSIANHDKSDRDFYNALTAPNTWLRWEEDPNKIVYEIYFSQGQGDADYDDYHTQNKKNAAGIYNYDGGKNKPRTWRANKTRRLYLKLRATGYMDPGSTGNYVFDPAIKGADPTWVSNFIDSNHTQGVYSASNTSGFVQCTPTIGWKPTTNHKFSGGSIQTGAQTSIQQPTTSGNNPFFGEPGNPGNNVITTPGNPSLATTVVQDTENFHNTIQLVEKYNPESEKKMSENPAVFETEPKEDVGLDIYYEMDQAFPTSIDSNTNELFAKVGSEVQIDYPGAKLQNWKDLTPGGNPWTITVTSGNNFGTTNTNVSHWVEEGFTIQNSSSLIPSVFPSGTTVADVDGNTVYFSEDATSSVTNAPVTFTKVSLPKIKAWNENKITLDTIVYNPQQFVVNVSTAFTSDNVVLPVAMAGPNNKNNLIFKKPNGGTITGSITGDGATVIGASVNPSGLLELSLVKKVHNSKIDLKWHNCYSFGNGVESNRIRDDFNAVTIDKGPRASTVLAKTYKRERKSSSLIYSGIYNNISGVNETNQFIMAEKITKNLNPRHGSIQKLHAREGDLIALCEDKVLKILSNKDALFNADGKPQLVATSNVLGQATPMGGEYGISKNPESFASQAYKAYFTDKSRGKVLQLDGNGLIPISDHGLKDYFADNLPNQGLLIGSYDDKKDNYNISLQNKRETVSYGVRNNGWESFKSFLPQSGLSINNNYYTFSAGELYRHHDGNTGTFYGLKQNPFVNVIFNKLPNVVKSFGSLNYEGSQARVTEDIGDNEYFNNTGQPGWFVSEGETNLQSTSLLEFKNKEGKWFSRIKGESTNASNIDLKEFSFQGIDIASSFVEVGISGCTDPQALNFDPAATSDDGSCCFEYGCTDDQAGVWPSLSGLDRFGVPCVFPCVDASNNMIGFAAANYDPKFDCDDGNCNYPAFYAGCTDPNAVNYWSQATFDDGTCCYPGCIDPTALNYDPTACADDGSCTYCEQGSVAGYGVPGVGTMPNITQIGTNITVSNTNQFVVIGGQNTSNLVVGCEIISQYLPAGTVIIGIDTGAYGGSFSGATVLNLSNQFVNAPTGMAIPPAPSNQSFTVDYNCNCDDHEIRVSNTFGGVGDIDGNFGDNSYTVTTFTASNITAGTPIHSALNSVAAFLLIQPNAGRTIQASDFSISGATPASGTTFVGGTLPPEVVSVNFQDTENPVFLNYNVSGGSMPNPNYDANYSATPTNEIAVIVELNPIAMPSNDLVIEIDIDGFTQSPQPIINNVTIL